MDKVVSTVAAVEVYKDEIVQALLEGNEPINDDEELYAAFTQWAESNRLKINVEHDYDDDDDDY